MTTLLLDQKPIALRAPTLEQTILDRLEEETVVGLDELVEMLPNTPGTKSSTPWTSWRVSEKLCYVAIAMTTRCSPRAMPPE